MTADGASLAATVILLGPMLYFLVASPTFLLRPLSDPVVTWLLRGLFNVQFQLVGVTAATAALAFTLAAKPPIAIGAAAIAALALVARRWVLTRVDAALRARDGGDPDAVRRLRRLHWTGMVYNAAQFVAVVSSIRFAFGAAA